MVSQRLSNLSAVRKRHLLVEFSSLKHACPHGVFMSLTPGDPSLWSGVIFVRKGPYSPSILRFQISFPPTYPLLPPLVTFSTDIFHPLITPLTTYVGTMDSTEGGVSARDEERLPPGGFSLRHGFPAWFGRAGRRSADMNRTASGSLQTPPRGSGVGSPASGGGGGGSASPTPVKAGSGSGTGGTGTSRREEISTYEVLRYIRSTFDDEEVLDSIPLEAAGNPGAWHAWRTHRVKIGKITSPTHPIPGVGPSPISPTSPRADGASASTPSTSAPSREIKSRVASGGSSAPMTARRPGEWNWEGVWEVRSKRGMEASLAEAVLFGREVGDDLIRFLNLEGPEVEGIKENIVRSLEGVEEVRRGLV